MRVRTLLMSLFWALSAGVAAWAIAERPGSPAPSARDFPFIGGNLANQRHSALTAITRSNEQYVAILARGNSFQLSERGDSLWAFKIGGALPQAPAPPAPPTTQPGAGGRSGGPGGQ